MRQNNLVRTLSGALAMLFVILLTAFVAAAPAQALSVTYDDFAGVEPSGVNFISGMGVKNAEIKQKSDNFSVIHNIWATYASATAPTSAVYVSFNATFGTEANRAVNQVPGSITLLWPNKALLSDGSTADVELKIDQIEVSVGSKASTAPEGNTCYFDLVNGISSVNMESQILVSEPLQTQLESPDPRRMASSVGTSARCTVRILQHGTNTPIDSSHGGVLFGVRDLDVHQGMPGYTREQLFTVDENEDALVSAYEAPYTESVEFINGFSTPVHLPKKKALSTSLEQGLMTNDTGPHGLLRIHAEGLAMKRAQRWTLFPTTLDPNTYYSGFMAVASPQSFSFYWNGYGCGTILFHSAGTSVTASKEGEGTIDREGTTEYAIGSAVTYNYQPAAGYKTTSLKVDDSPVSFTASGGSYKFDQLVSNPLAKFDDSGNIVGSYAKNYKIQVKYEPINYIVKFDKNATDATGTMADQEMEYDVAENLNAIAFARTGWNWRGWNTKPDGSGTGYTDKQSVENLTTEDGGTVTLYAQWSKRTLNVIYKDGYTGGVIDRQTVEYGGDATPPEKPAHTGYKPGDWDKSSTNITQDNFVITVPYSPVNYEIAFDKNASDAVGSMPNQEMEYDTAENLDANQFSWEGHTWTGWNTKANGSGESYRDKQSVKNLTATDGEIITLYAQWRANPVTVTYVDGHTGDILDSQTIDYGSDATPPTKPEHTGYKPGDWDKPSTNITEDTVITVPYSPIGYIIKFDKNANDATGSMNDQQMLYDTPANLTANAFSRTGWTWKSWNDAPNGSGTSYTNQQEVNNLTATDGGIVTLYAQWEHVMLTVTYVDGHDNSIIDTQTVAYGDDATPPTKPEHAGYKPGDWNKPSTNITEDTAIVVNYTPISYIIKYDKNEPTATGTMSDQQMYYDQPDNLLPNAFTSSAKTWKNWNTKANGSGTTYNDRDDIINLTATDGGTVTLYAQWQDRTFTVTYVDGKTSTVIGTQQVPYGGNATPPNKPSHPGYKPGEWDKSSNNITQDTTITVPYSPIAYVIVYDKNASDATGSMADQNMLFDQAANLTSNAFIRSGWAFGGWKDDSGNRYSNAQQVINLADTDGARVTLHAQWTEAGTTYTVNHVIQGQVEPFETETMEGVTGDDTQAAPIKKTGYVVEAYQQQKIKSDGSTVVTITYRPAVYRILFDPNAEDATGEMGPQEMEYDKAENLTPNAFEREGYMWAGWLDENGMAYTDKQEVINLTFEEDGEVVLYAQWEKLYHVVWIDLVRNVPILKEGWAADLDTVEPPAEPKREGYTFAGWDKEVDDEGNITYTAKWEPISAEPEPEPEPESVAPQPAPIQPAPQPVQAAPASDLIVSTGDASAVLIAIITGAALAAAGIALRRKHVI